MSHLSYAVPEVIDGRQAEILRKHREHRCDDLACGLTRPSGCTCALDLVQPGYAACGIARFPAPGCSQAPLLQEPVNEEGTSWGLRHVLDDGSDRACLANCFP